MRTKLLTYPECSQQVAGLKGGQVVRRTCTRPGPHYKCLVTVAECARCQDPSLPSLPTQALSYAEAVARWIVAGRPTRSDEEVARIFEQRCQPCAPNGRCPFCGCRVARDGYTLLNKIKMATESCPQGRW